MFEYVYGLSKFKDIKINTNDELEEYLDGDDDYVKENEIVLFNGNLQFWVSKWFSNKVKSLNDITIKYRIITKEIVNEFVDHCDFILKNGFNEFYDDGEFESHEEDVEMHFEEVSMEICDTRDRFEQLLKQDFEHNTFIYWELR